MKTSDRLKATRKVIEGTWGEFHQYVYWGTDEVSPDVLKAMMDAERSLRAAIDKLAHAHAAAQRAEGLEVTCEQPA